MKRRGFLASLLLLARPSWAAQTLHAFGDSITQGWSATNMYGFAQRIAAAKGWTLDDRSYNGHQVADTADRVYSFPVQPNDISIWLAGFNDYRYFGSSAIGHETYRAGLTALAAWLTIPESAKVRAGMAAASGGWNPTSVYGGMGRYSSTKGAALSCRVTGSVIYVAGIAMTNPTGGIFGVTVDGKPAGVGNCLGSALTYSGIGYSPFLVRIDGLRPGAHDVAVTVQSSVGNVFVDWIAGNVSGPSLYLGAPPRIADYAGPVNPDFLKGSDALVAKYADTTRDVARLLRSDGLDVIFVDPNLRYRPELGDENPPDVHPNDQGHARIAEAFLALM